MVARTSQWFRGMLAGMVVLGLVWVGGATAGWCADLAPGTQGFAGLSAERDWPWWRGPARNGWSPASATAPTTWSDAQHVLWRVPLPGRGHSSPIVVGERIYLTTADTRQQIHAVMALERATGRQIWKVDVSQGGFPARNHPKNTEATCTLACDGERLFAAFFHHQQIEVVALDLEGKQRWRTKAQAFHPQRYEYGYAPSPLLYRDLVIIAGEYDGESFLTALDRAQGQPRWRTPRPANITFSSPVVAHVAGRDQLLLSGSEQVASYDPQTGQQLWSTPGTTAATCGTMVWDGDVVIASGGYPKAETLAVRADGSGKVLWRNGQKCYEQSLLAVDGHVYGLTDNGILFCWRVADGRELWKERLKGPVSASPVLVNGRIYWTNEFGTTYVFRPNPQRFDLVAQNQLGDEGFASPAVSGDRLFLRTAVGNGERRQEFLYCLGEKK